MERQYISGEAWYQFEQKHPSAHSFLLAASLRGEHRSLTAELARCRQFTCEHFTKRRVWILARLKELELVKPPGFYSEIAPG